ncbi:hypothetical protein ABZ907_38905 [Nonomuraea wenchangensis]
MTWQRVGIPAFRRKPPGGHQALVSTVTAAPAHRAIDVLHGLGCSRVDPLEGGLDGWTAAGGELFQDVNVPSKAFGELVESVRRTPSLTAQHVQALIDAGTPPVIVDARRVEECQTMSIPTATSVRGARVVVVDDDGVRTSPTGVLARAGRAGPGALRGRAGRSVPAAVRGDRQRPDGDGGVPRVGVRPGGAA